MQCVAICCSVLQRDMCSWMTWYFTHSNMWQDRCMCHDSCAWVPGLSRIYDMTHSNKTTRWSIFLFSIFFIDPVIRLLRMCDVTEIHMSNTTHSYIHTCGTTYSYVWHQGVAVHYSALQRAAVRCSALWCVAVRCSALLQCVEVCSRVQTLDLRDSARCRAKVCICRIFRTSPRSYSLFAAKFWRSACVCSYSKIARPNIAYVDVSWNIQSSGCQKQKKRMPSIKHRQ